MIEASTLAEAARLGQFRTIVAFEGGQPVRRVQALEPLVRYGLVVAGAGAAWLPAFLCQPDVVRGTLMELMPEESRGPIDIHALYTAQASTTPKVRAFVRFLTRIMGPLSLPAG